MAFQFTNVFAVDAAADVIAGTLAPGTSPAQLKVHLYTNNYTPLATSQISDFTEATYTGYASQVVAAWDAPTQDGLGEVEYNGTTVLDFVGPSSGSAETIYGYYVVSGGGDLVGGEKFASPRPLATALQSIKLLANFTFVNTVDVSFILT